MIDPTDTLARIAKEYPALGLTCECGEGEACSVCEIQYLLDEWQAEQQESE